MNIGRKIEITDLIERFEAKEGDVEHITGKTGQGKTYEATRRALDYLENGNVVYTTWRLNLPEHFDQRKSIKHIVMNLLFFRKHFFTFEYHKNWHYVNLDDYLDDGVFDTEKFSRFLAGVTDAIFFLDEGQDVFDSHQKAGKIARQTITRTRHMHKKLIIVSQRAQAVDVTARGNVTYFYRCEARHFPFLPTFFKVFITDEIDQSNNYPLWVRHDSQGEVIWKADVYHSGFAKKKIYDAYDSWYMRKNMKKSQDVHVHAYELTFRQRLSLLLNTLLGRNKLSTGYPQVDDKPKKIYKIPPRNEKGRFIKPLDVYKSKYPLLLSRNIKKLKVLHLTGQSVL